ncbi:MAG: AraC family transcriptional regulator [Acidobacteriota bacterium]
MNPRPEQRQLIERLLPVLMRIQARLDEEWPLAALAREAEISPTHFHRLFRQLTAETPKQFCQRLRLERSAFRLLLSRKPILEIALECGFNHHETFTRAFSKHFGCSPSAYRRARLAERPTEGSGALTVDEMPSDYEVSATKIDELNDLTVAFIRHLGPYEQVDARTWDRLVDWAANRDWPEPPLLLGIAQDAPGITPPEKMRFDSALRAPEPFAAEGEIGCQVVAGGLYGVTTHIGHFSTLEQAYRLAFERLSGMRRYRVLGLPSVEIYQSTRISPDYELNQTDICIPLTLR